MILNTKRSNFIKHVIKFIQHLSSLMDGLAGNLFPSPNLGTPPRPGTGADSTNGNGGRSSVSYKNNKC